MGVMDWMHRVRNVPVVLDVRSASEAQPSDDVRRAARLEAASVRLADDVQVPELADDRTGHFRSVRPRRVDWTSPDDAGCCRRRNVGDECV